MTEEEEEEEEEEDDDDGDDEDDEDDVDDEDDEGDDDGVGPMESLSMQALITFLLRPLLSFCEFGEYDETVGEEDEGGDNKLLVSFCLLASAVLIVRKRGGFCGDPP